MIARLALVIAQFQCDEMYRGHDDAVSELLPLDDENWITSDNSLRLNWMEVCPPHGLDPVVDDDGELKFKKSNQSAVKFQSSGGEVYICGNPPFLSSGGYGGWSAEQYEDMKRVFGKYGVKYGRIDYVTAWFIRAAEYIRNAGDSLRVASAFVSTSSICQGEQVPVFWPSVFGLGCRIKFAYTSFKWKNHASDNAAVSVVIVGLSNNDGRSRVFSVDSSGETFRDVDNIGPYLVPGDSIVVNESRTPLCEQPVMYSGNQPRDDGGGLTLSREELKAMSLSKDECRAFVRPYVGSKEFIKGIKRHCLWIEERRLDEAMKIEPIRKRLDSVRKARLSARVSATKGLAEQPHKFGQFTGVAKKSTMIVPGLSTERREYLTVGLFPTEEVVVANTVHALFDAPLWNFSLLSSRLHMVWVATVGGKLKTDIRYSNIICWNTFPIPKLTTKNKTDMEKYARGILTAREDRAPATIAELYDPDNMPKCLREAHTRNDEVIARIYIGRDNFHDDTEMREKLFHMYADMMKDPATTAKQKKATRSNKPLKDGLFAGKQSSAPAPKASPKEARKNTPDRNPATPKSSGKPTNRKPGKPA